MRTNFDKFKGLEFRKRDEEMKLHFPGKFEKLILTFRILSFQSTISEIRIFRAFSDGA